MVSGPPKTFEALVAIVIPPACREEVLGDLHERYRSAAQYGLDAAGTVPFVILSRIHRTADSRALLIRAFAFYASLLAAAWINSAALLRDDWGLLRLAIPAAAAMLGVMLGDAYANPGLQRPLKLTLVPVQGAGLALASQGLIWLFSPDFAVPRSVLLYGCAGGLLLSSGVRILFLPTRRDDPKDDHMKLLNAKAAIAAATSVIVAATIWIAAEKGRGAEPRLTYSQFLASVQSGQVASVTIIGSNSGAARADGRLKDGSTVRTVLPSNYQDVLRAIEEQSVNIEIRDLSSDPLRLLLNTTPFLVLLGFWFFMMRKLRNDRFRNGWTLGSGR
jgi:hypothetical protein